MYYLKEKSMTLYYELITKQFNMSESSCWHESVTWRSFCVPFWVQSGTSKSCTGTPNQAWATKSHFPFCFSQTPKGRGLDEIILVLDFWDLKNQINSSELTLFWGTSLRLWSPNKSEMFLLCFRLSLPLTSICLDNQDWAELLLTCNADSNKNLSVRRVNMLNCFDKQP